MEFSDAFALAIADYLEVKRFRVDLFDIATKIKTFIEYNSKSIAHIITKIQVEFMKKRFIEKIKKASPLHERIETLTLKYFKIRNGTITSPWLVIAYKKEKPRAVALNPFKMDNRTLNAIKKKLQKLEFLNLNFQSANSTIERYYNDDFEIFIETYNLIYPGNNLKIVKHFTIRSKTQLFKSDIKKIHEIFLSKWFEKAKVRNTICSRYKHEVWFISK